MLTGPPDSRVLYALLAADHLNRERLDLVLEHSRAQATEHLYRAVRLVAHKGAQDT